MILQAGLAELGRRLKLEEHRNRDLPELTEANTAEDFEITLQKKFAQYADQVFSETKKGS